MPKLLDTVSEKPVIPPGHSIKAPRSAAIAGIIFAVLYGSSLVLMVLSIPPYALADYEWVRTHAKTVEFALIMVPFSGIAFLWFIGVIRDQLGDVEDRFFSTVFLGGGLLFLTLTFIAAAFVGGLLSSYALLSSTVIESGVFLYGRTMIYQVLNLYAIRMAGVFMISLGTIWLRTGVMHRAWALVTYALALVLLLSIGFSLWVLLIFPAWVLAVSVHLLVLNLRNPPDAVNGEVH
ncbi:hypothetical protein [Methanofollis ethanolicus]|uniref:hypothetical protein n=1 Tax=Methanofollis ethanolicus TaxID=488124 RepID=UPI00083173F0|nr:hypothetical protein [Methanofollis ethanolicus]